LVATDVASRGIHIPDIELIIQLEPPKDTESYIHRSGRTARCGKSGTCITLYNRRNKEFLDRIEDMAGIKMEMMPVPSDNEMPQNGSHGMVKKFANVKQDAYSNFQSNNNGNKENMGASNFGGNSKGGYGGGGYKGGNDRDFNGGGYKGGNDRDFNGGGYKDRGQNDGGYKDRSHNDGGYKDRGQNDGGYNHHASNNNHSGGGYNNNRREQRDFGGNNGGGYKGGN
jgi:superfamily II DNA/RNA helicase